VARKVLQRHVRSEEDEEVHYTSYRGAQDRFSEVVDALEELGLEMRDTKVIVVEELPGEALSMVEEGRVHVLRALLRADQRVIAEHMARAMVDLQCFGLDDTRDLLLPLLLDQHPDLKGRVLLGEQDQEKAA
jgi:hypothetical protein